MVPTLIRRGVRREPVRFEGAFLDPVVERTSRFTDGGVPDGNTSRAT